MNSVLIYRLDQSGVYLGEDRAFESPREPGVFLYPPYYTTVAPPTLQTGQYAQWDGEKWLTLPAPIAPPTTPLTAAEVLQLERQSMNPPKSAFMEAAVMLASYEPSHQNLLETFDVTMAALGPRNPLERWDRSVSTVVRLHPDMANFMTAFRMGAEKLDAMCRLALAYDANPSSNPADFATEIAAFNAIAWEAASS